MTPFFKLNSFLFPIKVEIMSNQFFYEVGQGHVIDEHGCPEPMDYVVDEETYTLQTLSSHTDYLHTLYGVRNHKPVAMHANEVQSKDVHMKESVTKRDYTVYTDQDKVRFFKLMFEKVLSASAAAKLLGIHVRSAQRWALQYEKDPDSIFKKGKSSGRPRILNNEHKTLILEWVDENPSIVLEQLMEKLRQRFEGIQVSKTILYRFYGMVKKRVYCCGNCPKNKGKNDYYPGCNLCLWFD
ncbi:hypothetical protein BCV72DRAFT_299098 [Rhizopus microsporus var. microsporus]|uniref:Uncharacterized protein n=1 Tax=Rhizopus microsporus var. microsporus TaxID=86635 RepID=A0A1X0QPA4_RHIZD|nr:hypothetical protein BCV72DRAFT_299098 [Rhizopus microsporus var. microsporus]